MANENALGLEYARRVWDKTSASWVGLKIGHMSVDDARNWERDIQPEIRRIALEEIAKGLTLTRSDHEWPWVDMRWGLPLAQRFAGRRCRGLTLHLVNDSGNATIAGMLLLIEDYPWLLQRSKYFWERFNLTKESTFTWFLTSAPKTALKALGVSKTPSLMRVLIDTALLTSMALGHKGRMWLHAAPEGGNLLFDLYKNRCKLHPVQQGRRVPKLARPFIGIPSDGRHFFATPRVARRLVNELQENRKD